MRRVRQTLTFHTAGSGFLRRMPPTFRSDSRAVVTRSACRAEGPSSRSRARSASSKPGPIRSRRSVATSCALTSFAIAGRQTIRTSLGSGWGRSGDGKQGIRSPSAQLAGFGQPAIPLERADCVTRARTHQAIQSATIMTKVAQPSLSVRKTDGGSGRRLDGARGPRQ